MKKPERTPCSVNILDELIERMAEVIEESDTYRNRSHFIEIAIRKELG